MFFRTFCLASLSALALVAQDQPKTEFLWPDGAPFSFRLIVLFAWAVHTLILVNWTLAQWYYKFIKYQAEEKVKLLPEFIQKTIFSA